MLFQINTTGDILIWLLHISLASRFVKLCRIGGLQSISRDTDNNAAMYNCAGGGTKGANEKFLCSSTNMAAMT